VGVPEASIEQTDEGVVVASPGWYPVTEPAQKHGVAAPEDTHDPRQAYRDVPQNFERRKAPWPV